MSSIPRPWFLRALESSFDPPTTSKLDVIDSRTYNLSRRISSLPPIYTPSILKKVSDLIVNPQIDNKDKAVIDEELINSWKLRVEKEFLEKKKKKKRRPVLEKGDMTDSSVGRVGDDAYYIKKAVKQGSEDNEKSVLSDVEFTGQFEDFVQKAVLDNEKFKTENVFITDIGKSKAADKYMLPYSSNSFRRHPLILDCFDTDRGEFDKDKLKIAYWSLKKSKLKKTALSESLEELWNQRPNEEDLRKKRNKSTATKPVDLTDSRKKIRRKLRYGFEDLKKLQNRLLVSEAKPAAHEGLRKKFALICNEVGKTFTTLDKLEQTMYESHVRDKSREITASQLAERRRRDISAINRQGNVADQKLNTHQHSMHEQKPPSPIMVQVFDLPSLPTQNSPARSSKTRSSTQEKQTKLRKKRKAKDAENTHGESTDLSRSRDQFTPGHLEADARPRVMSIDPIEIRLD